LLLLLVLVGVGVVVGVVVYYSKPRLATAMTTSVKRTRFDASALSPEDKATTPMASARRSLTAYCTSLQPEIATILSRLGLEILSLTQNFVHRVTQVKKIEDEITFIPRSARVNFTLIASKEVETDAEYIRLRDETVTLISTFQTDLKDKIVEVAKLEMLNQKTKLHSQLATNLRLAVQAYTICESNPLLPSVDQIVNTILSEYGMIFLQHFDTTISDFRETYKSTHTLPNLPEALSLNLDDPTHSSIPSTKTLQALSTLWRTIETIFIQPWSTYLAVKKRLDIKLQLKKLGTDHFGTQATDSANNLINKEAPVNDKLMRDIIKAQVTAQTKQLRTQIATLKNQTIRNPPSRGPQSASLKKKTKKVVVKPNAINDTSGKRKETKQQGRQPSRKRSKKKSILKQPATSTLAPRSKQSAT
jgi:hypothetical protein